jgi:hypothetical protein
MVQIALLNTCEVLVQRSRYNGPPDACNEFYFSDGTLHKRANSNLPANIISLRADARYLRAAR